MPGARCDVAVPEQGSLVDVGLKFRLAALVGDIPSPAHEMRDRSLRPVAVENFQPQAVRRQIVLHFDERHRGLPCQETKRGLVAVDTTSDEIMLAEVAHLHMQTGNRRARINEGRMTGLRIGRACDKRRDQ